MKSGLLRGFVNLVLSAACLQQANALNPRKSFTQYSRTLWNQQQGLPQDTITAVTQTANGYLWLGTDEGLVQFDGYDFTVLNVATGHLPSNSIKALAVGTDDSLWVGTSNGLVRLTDKKIQLYTTANGLPNNAIDELCVDHAGNLWIAASGALARFDGKNFSAFLPGKDIPITVRTVYEDRHNVLWVAGLGGVVQFLDGKFVSIIPWSALSGSLISKLIVDREGNLWVAGSLGILQRSPQNRIRSFTKQDGLPDSFIRALWQDRDGNLWAGTNSGLARLRGDRFVAEGPGELIRCLFEDNEHDLWVGSRNGLSRLRDDVFTVYGKSEGLPSDSPNSVFEDREHRVWVGFHDKAFVLFSPKELRAFTTKDGFPADEVFSIRQSRSGDLLLSTRSGLVRMRGWEFHTYLPPDAFGRPNVFDALEDSSGKIWVAVSDGLGVLQGDKLRLVFRGGPSASSAVVTLHESKDGTLWAGAYQMGLFRIRGQETRRFTTEDGLSSNQIRAVIEDNDGTLWIATFGGGLNALRQGKFTHYRMNDGLLSDNISNIVDDGESLWLGTTRGLCRTPKAQLRDFSAGKIDHLHPTNFGVEDGLRSAQAAPGYPIAAGGIRSSDGRLWFPTSNGLAVIDSNRPQPPGQPLKIHLVGLAVDGKPVDPSDSLKLTPKSGRLQIRYTAIHLSAPERIEYSYKLEGLDPDWVQAGKRRETNYTSLPHGTYRFVVRAALPGEKATEQSYYFEKLPRFYETTWFRVLCLAAVFAAIWGIHQMRVRRLRYGFALVLEERARLAREIHDTLTQGFVGISSQLEALASALPDSAGSAWDYLEVARKMVRHSLTEARRAMSDLRGTALQDRDLETALRCGAEMWTLGSDVAVDIDAPNASVRCPLPEESKQHLLRIAQEAVTNVVKHAHASKVRIKLYNEASALHLLIADNGRGIQKEDPFSLLDGHFGLIGMRERTGRLGGELRLTSPPGGGTEIEVTVPLQ
jgi:signal transduction histidine kinase/ligand-binding sensor domain-containing protein